jgi:hypothetical protein
MPRPMRKNPTRTCEGYDVFISTKEGPRREAQRAQRTYKFVCLFLRNRSQVRTSSQSLGSEELSEGNISSEAAPYREDMNLEQVQL